MIGGKAFADEDSVCFTMAADTDGVEVAKDSIREPAGVLRTGSRSFYRAARKDGDLLELSGLVACTIAELKRLGAHSTVIYPQVIAPRLAQIYGL